jgi:hypothetical protein
VFKSFLKNVSYNKYLGKGHYYEFHNVEIQKERWKIAIDHYIEKIYNSDQNVESEKDQNIESENITMSKVVDHYYKNVEKNEKNVESLIFVWFSHFNYLWRILTTYG